MPYPTGGSVELREGDGTVAVLALLQGYVENQGDAWSYTQGVPGTLPDPVAWLRLRTARFRTRRYTPAIAC